MGQQVVALPFSIHHLWLANSLAAVEKLLRSVFFRIARSMALHLAILATFSTACQPAIPRRVNQLAYLASLPDHES